MGNDLPQELERRLAGCQQMHLLHWWKDLTESQRHSLRAQIEGIDLDLIASLFHSHQNKNLAAKRDGDANRAQRAVPPVSVVRLPSTTGADEKWEQASRVGDELLAGGKVGAILVAGGQGTRLGFDKPKGILPIGPVSGASLFQILAEQVVARSHRAGRPIPYFIMTSNATHNDTVEYFSQNKHFGLPEDDVYFFMQGNMPAVDAESGRLLLSAKDSLSLSPDGHGGMLAALKKAGLLDVMQRRGIEFLHYHQVDNPTAVVCDPAFLGFHRILKSQMSTKVVAKRSAEERMGVVVDVDGKTQIIEYSDLSSETARRTDENGNLLLWAGNTAIHIFDREFLEQTAKNTSALPFHVARKKVPFCDANGNDVAPESENAYKFERFIFDALPWARQALVLETDRQREFNPVKNATGDDSPQSAKMAMTRLHQEWLRAAGALVDESCAVEISPLFALDVDEVRKKIKPGTRFTEPTCLR